MSGREIAKDVVAGIVTNNPEGLVLCLSSILNGTTLPSGIVIHYVAGIPNIPFYLQQLLSLARIRGINTAVSFPEYNGIRFHRDSFIHNSLPGPDMVWLVDDDVCVEPDCLYSLYQTARIEQSVNREWSYICANKIDVNNRRGYGDFTSKEIQFDGADDSPTYLNYGPTSKTCRITAADTGCMLTNRNWLKKHGITFVTHEVHYNSGGSDSVFGIRCDKAGVKGILCPAAKCWHLEKPNVNFNEASNRCESVLRTVESLGLADGTTEFKVMPWVKPFIH